MSAESSRPSTAVAIDQDDIGGVVTSRFGPEAGVWVVAETGEVLKTSLSASDDRIDSFAVIIVEYRPDPKLGFLVPTHMSESYRRQGSLISAEATYSNFRQFQTSGRVVTDRQR